MPDRLRVVYSTSMDPAVNLASEEWLMETLADQEYLLFLWQNRRTVVIGRNQNPYQECPVQRLEDEGVHLVRRLSGGGAVYHDGGNLNFTFLSNEEEADVGRNMDIVIQALKSLGITAVFSGRNDLTVDDKKISGSAFFTEKGVHCHHGTLLYDVQIPEMVRYLSVSPLKLQTKGIASVRSRVVNLKKLVPSLTLEDLKKALIEAFVSRGDQPAVAERISGVEKEMEPFVDKYKDWSWNFGESPQFSVVLEHKSPLGLMSLHLDLIDGHIEQAKCYTDILEEIPIQAIEMAFVGMPLDRQALEDVLSKYDFDASLNESIRALLSSVL